MARPNPLRGVALCASLLSLALPATAHAHDLIDSYQLGERRPPPDAPEPPPAPRAPPEPPGPRFGAQGSFVVSASAGGSTGAGIGATQYDASDASSFSVGVSPGFDYFLVRNFSIGLDLGVSYGETKLYAADSSLVDTKSSTISGGLRLGVNLPLGERVSWYPRLTLGVQSSHSDATTVAGNAAAATANAGSAPSLTVTGPWVNLFTPLLLHPAPHFFVGFGPRLYHSFAHVVGGSSGASGEQTGIGALFILGGHWGGETPPVAPATEGAPAPDVRVPRFGERGQLVLTGDTSASVGYTSFAGTQDSSFGISLAPGVDYFVFDHVSFGLDFWISYGTGTALDSSHTKVDTSSTSYGIAPRVGVDVPLGRWLSLYPRAELGIGRIDWDETSGMNENQHTESRTFVSLEAPLLVHAVPHFFIGFGPYVTHDFDRTDQFGVDNRGTSYGASLLIGGWVSPGP